MSEPTDAAHKRERGDCAKLREACEAALDLFWDIHNANRSPQSNQAYAVIRQIKAALAEPPRNCDRFDSSTQARAEWYKTEVLPRVEGVVSGVEPPFVDWLFAPAAEKEGGNDAD